MQVAQTALGLVGSIYDAAAAPEVWPEVLQNIGTALESVAGCFTIDDLRGPTTNITLSFGMDPQFQQRYHEYYQQINIHMIRGRPLLPPGRVISSQMLCTDRELFGTEYYQDFLRTQDLFYPIGACITRMQPATAVVTFYHSHSQGPCGEEQTRLLELLMPHL